MSWRRAAPQSARVYYDSPVLLRTRRERRCPFSSDQRLERAFVWRPRFKPAGCGHDGHRMDFAHGAAEMARAITARETFCLSPDFCVHINELVQAIQNLPERDRRQSLRTSFRPAQPNALERVDLESPVSWVRRARPAR